MTNSDVDKIIAGMPEFEYIDGKQMINTSNLTEKLISNPRQIFVIPTVTTSPKSKLSSIIENSMKNESNLLSVSNGIMFNKHFAFKGNVEGDVENAIAKCMSAGTFKSANYQPTSSFSRKSCFVKNKLEESFVNLTTLTNNSGISQSFQMLLDRFVKHFSRRAFLHIYTGEGMDQMEFTEAESSLNDLISVYNSK